MDGLNLDGFSAPVSLSMLYDQGCGDLPRTHGVYVVVRGSNDPPEFLEVSPAGWYKGLDPSYPADFVRTCWVPGANVVYVGKCESQRGLRDRVRRLVRFGFGHNVSHRGGRLLWHLADAPSLLIRWREVEAADAVETAMIRAFRSCHGARPFANLTK